MFGEECLYEEHRWECSCIASSSVTLVFLSRQLLESVMQSSPGISAPVKKIVELRDQALEPETLARTWPFVAVPRDLLDEVAIAFDQVGFKAFVYAERLGSGCV